MTILILREQDYFDEQVEMHYALHQSAERIGRTPHTHEFFEIFLLINGRIDHMINGRKLTLVNGSMTFIRPHDVHHYWPISGCECHIINLAIARRAIEDLFTYLGDGFDAQRILNLPLPPTVNLSPVVKQQVQAQLEQLNSIPLDQPAVKRTTLRMLLFELVTQYFPLVKQETAADLPDWLQQTCRAMQRPENLAAGVPRMLSLAAVSAEHLSRTVRRFFNQTPTEYINQLRLNYAANLLTHGDQDIVDIAAEVGFDSLSYFYARFKEQYQQTPRQFRRVHQIKLPHTK